MNNYVEENFDRNFLLDKFYIPFGGYEINRHIPSNYKSYFIVNNNSGYHLTYACGQDNVGNILIQDIYYLCNNFDHENNICNGDYVIGNTDFYVLTSKNNLFSYNSNYYDSSVSNALECNSEIVINDNFYDDLFYTGQTNEILPLMFYFSIPLLIVLFAVKVFRKGIH